MTSSFFHSKTLLCGSKPTSLAWREAECSQLSHLYTGGLLWLTSVWTIIPAVPASTELLLTLQPPSQPWWPSAGQRWCCWSALGSCTLARPQSQSVGTKWTQWCQWPQSGQTWQKARWRRRGGELERLLWLRHWTLWQRLRGWQPPGCASASLWHAPTKTAQFNLKRC